MHAKGYSLAIVLGSVGIFLMPQVAHAKSPLVGTRWFKNSSCLITMIDFYDRGIAQSETSQNASWLSSGKQLTIKFSDLENSTDEVLIGTLEGKEFRAIHSYKYRGKPQNEACTFKQFSK